MNFSLLSSIYFFRVQIINNPLAASELFKNSRRYKDEQQHYMMMMTDDDEEENKRNLWSEHSRVNTISAQCMYTTADN